MANEKSISEQLQEIADEFCQNYCKHYHPDKISDEEYTRLLVEVCENCPISKLT